jgi:hypothetical protein
MGDTYLFLKYMYLFIVSKIFLQKILTFHNWENINVKFISLIEIWVAGSQKQLARSHSQIPNIYFRKGNKKCKG